MTQGLPSSFSSSPFSRSDLQAVWSAFGQGCRRLLLHPQAPWRRLDENSGNHHHHRHQLRAEREKILTHLQPAAMGLFVTAFCFATFRLSGSRWWKQVREMYFYNSPVGASSTTTALSSSSLSNQHFLARQTENKQERIRELMQLPLDLMLSILLGSCTFLIQFDSDKLQEDVVQMPLLPGQSLVHECICPNVVEAVLACSKQANSDDNSTTVVGDEETQKFFLKFAENCQTRSRFVQRRQQLGVPHPEWVPQPGLQGPITR